MTLAFLTPSAIRHVGRHNYCCFQHCRRGLGRDQWDSSPPKVTTRSNGWTKMSKRNAFSFAGPRSLDEILKMELIRGKSAAEVKDIWMSHHESKENMHGLLLNGEGGKSVLSRAKKCPFFVQPVFRDDGFFMLISQFQTPSHFLMAYLEDYKMDPNRAQPLLTFSIFVDLADALDVSLVRCDIINKGIEDSEGLKVVRNMLNAYQNEDEYEKVHTFNKAPDSFDFDDYISCQNQKWKEDDAVEEI